MKSKLLLFAAATSLAIVASASTFAAGTSSPLDAKSAATLPAATNAYANAAITTVQVEPSAIATVKYIVDIKAGVIPDFMGIKADANSSSPGAWTITKTRGTIDDGSATLKTALVNSSPQGGGYSATTTLAAGTGSSTAAPAIGYTVIDLAKLTKPDGSVTRVTT